jgi:hypothetical protein
MEPHNGGNNGKNGLKYDITHAAANLPRLALDPRGFVINSAIEQAFEMQKALMPPRISGACSCFALYRIGGSYKAALCS